MGDYNQRRDLQNRGKMEKLLVVFVCISSICINLGATQSDYWGVESDLSGEEPEDKDRGDVARANPGCKYVDCRKGGCKRLANGCYGREGDGCLASTSKVETMSGIKYISELVLGDFVRTSSGGRTHFTEFLGWLQRQKSSTVEMVEISTTKGVSNLILTQNHIVFTTNTTKYADELQLGDYLVYWNGSQIVDERVTEMKKTSVVGSFTPLTRDGTLLVDGYLASDYASFSHQLSDLAMIPVKAMPKVLLDDEESQHKDGVRSVVKVLMNLGEMIGARERNLKDKDLSIAAKDLSIDMVTQLDHLTTKSEF